MQAKDENGEWQEVKVFEEGMDHALNDSPFSFEHTDISDTQTYRLILDYVIEETDEEQNVIRTFHKGHVLLEQRNSIEKKEQSKKNIEMHSDQSVDQCMYFGILTQILFTII